jgi:hypothetical protein
VADSIKVHRYVSVTAGGGDADTEAVPDEELEAGHHAGTDTAVEAGAESGVDSEAGPTAGANQPRRGSRRRLLWRIAGVAAVVVLVVCGFVTWQAFNNDSKVLSQVAGTQTARDPKNPALVTYTDNETRLRLSFPGSWTTRVAGGADVRLIAGPGNGDLMSVRVVNLDTGTNPPTPTNLKPYLDTIVDEPGVTVLQQNQTTMNGQQGWYYVYTFQNGNQTGLHAQYFIIRGQQLYSIVFQALPESDFARLAPTYQQVANSIRFY